MSARAELPVLETPAEPESVLRAGLTAAGGTVSLACSFSIEDVVLIDLLCTHDLLREFGTEIFALDTGRLHEASQSYTARLTNRRGPAWWRQAARAVRPFLDPGQAALLDAEIKFQTGFGRGKLPKGAIHGDLFCDNVLFAGARVAGIIDFGFAATDFYAFDLAITANDWCVDDATGAFDESLLAAMLAAYERVRPLTRDECEAWPALLRAAALRFWLSRLYDLHLPRPGELVHAHDPAHFERILRHRVATMPAWPRRAVQPS